MSSPVPTAPEAGARKHVPFVPGTHADEGIYSARRAARALDDGRSGSGQRLPRLARRHHHRRYVSRRSDCDGGYAGMEGIAARRKYCPNRRLDRRVGRRRSHFHSARVSSGQSVAIVSLRRRVLEIHRADHGGQHSRRALHFSGAPRHGGRSRVALPGIFSGIGDSQSRTARRASREISFLEHRRWRRGLHAGQIRLIRRRYRSARRALEVWAAVRFVSAAPEAPTSCLRVEPPCLRRPA